LINSTAPQVSVGTSDNPNNVVYSFPPRVVWLGEALVPVAKNLRHALSKRVKPSGHEFVTLDDLSHHMGVIAPAIAHLSSPVENMMANVFNNESATVSDAHRAAGRLEQVISEFVEGYLAVKASRSGPQTVGPRTLLLGVYRHHLREICNWLEELIQAISNPLAAVEKRGLALTANTSLTFTLVMTSPPEMERLEELAKSLLSDAEPPIENELPPRPQSEERARPGILGTIGALAFGIGISNSVFGRYRD
jgi:hypothetical protein